MLGFFNHQIPLGTVIRGAGAVGLFSVAYGLIDLLKVGRKEEHRNHRFDDDHYVMDCKRSLEATFHRTFVSAVSTLAMGMALKALAIEPSSEIMSPKP